MSDYDASARFAVDLVAALRDDVDKIAADYARLLLALQAERLEGERFADELRSEIGTLLTRIERLERNPLR